MKKILIAGRRARFWRRATGGGAAMHHEYKCGTSHGAMLLLSHGQSYTINPGQ